MEQTQRNRLRQALQQAGLPEFEVNARGFPLPGPVVRYYRENMTYTDGDGNVRHWTQVDLAKRLNQSERNVRLMETENKHLDSLERRWTLATLLKIPPALLGLASFEQLIDTLTIHDEHATLDQPHATAQKGTIGADEIQLYQDALPVLTHAYDQNTLTNPTIEAWIQRIAGSLDHVDNKSKNVVLKLLVSYHVLAGRVYSHDMSWVKATHHFNTATQLTTTVTDPDLKVFIHYFIGNMYLMQKSNLLARDEFDRALSMAKNVSPTVKGRVLGYTALTYAMTGAGSANTLYVQQLLEQAETCALAEGDSSLVTYDISKYFRDKADTLIALNQYTRASRAVEDAEDYLDNRKRSAAYLHILQSECYIKQKRPEYEEAITLLSQILEENGNIRYYVNYVARLYKLLVASPYGNAPDVADLGMMLRELKAKK